MESLRGRVGEEAGGADGAHGPGHRAALRPGPGAGPRWVRGNISVPRQGDEGGVSMQEHFKEEASNRDRYRGREEGGGDHAALA